MSNALPRFSSIAPVRKTENRPSICTRCNSCKYCPNKAPGMMACVDFNKYPRTDVENQ